MQKYPTLTRGMGGLVVNTTDMGSNSNIHQVLRYLVTYPWLGISLVSSLCLSRFSSSIKFGSEDIAEELLKVIINTNKHNSSMVLLLHLIDFNRSLIKWFLSKMYKTEYCSCSREFVIWFEIWMKYIECLRKKI
jgi:hypothetical protein